MYSVILFILIFAVSNIVVVAFEIKDKAECNCTLNHSENESGSRVLSRRKRFVIFPEGSSLQLVFCLQTSAVIPIGDIFLFGSTLSLNWQLPTEPKYLTMFKDYNDGQRRGDVTKKVVYYDEGGRIVEEVPYPRKTIINPAFAKRSLPRPQISYREQLKRKLENMRMHRSYVQEDYSKQHFAERESTDFHRNSRADLYEKIERLLAVLGQDGRNCVLHKLCTAAQERSTQGTFFQEFLKAVFTLPKGKPFDKIEHNEYDQAHDTSINCNEKYTACDDLDSKF